MDEREGECSGAELDELAGQFCRMHFSAAAAQTKNLIYASLLPDLLNLPGRE